MQVRIHPDIAAMIRRNAKAYKRMFKMHKSATCIVNEALRDLFNNPGEALILSPEAAGVPRSKEVKLFQRLPHP